MATNGRRLSTVRFDPSFGQARTKIADQWELLRAFRPGVERRGHGGSLGRGTPLGLLEDEVLDVLLSKITQHLTKWLQRSKSFREEFKNSMLLDDIKAQMFKAMKESRLVEKEILRVALGEITTNAARAGQSGSDDESRAVLRKLIKCNEESLAVCEDPEQRKNLELETHTLSAFLPTTLDVPGIIELLLAVREAIVAAGNDGQATGIAMKQLKATGAVVTGKDVATAVRQIRG